MYTVAIVDDQSVACAGLERLVSGAFDLVLVASVATVTELD